MTNIVNLPTYEQSEEIKSELKSMLESIVENNGVNISKCEPFSYQDAFNIPPGDTGYKKALEINGKGYLGTAVLRGDNSGNAIRISIDGKVVLETSSTQPTYFTGFTMMEYVQLNTSNQLSLFFSGNNYIKSDATAKFIPDFQINSVFLSNQFLFFEESLLVEFKRFSNTSFGNIPNFISGGKLK